MKQQVSPGVVAAVIVGLVVLLGGVGFFVFKGKSDGGSDGTQVIVKMPEDKDGRFKAHLPAGVSGGGG